MTDQSKSTEPSAVSFVYLLGSLVFFIILLVLTLAEVPDAWRGGYMQEHILVSGFMMLVPLTFGLVAGASALSPPVDNESSEEEKSDA
ncbi:hypothetical protein QTO30_20860 [Yoonia sp. GPGPB17]|uniref:hypothetical protein n=1 Tax=Yoonia sp. GPGPB17 TaxID=3026147 RepID=UPI0030BAC098